MSREQCQPLCPLNSHYVSQKDCFQVLVMMCNGVELDALQPVMPPLPNLEEKKKN
ncbi:hypothetical protein PISMIDRAFT_589027 [Pisolithus microcarpus 441]|uniref:Uncharacterized protein n=1 Tax=Pisolithus microcarpus 441 TaxID=765257 RepID=A0A0D0A9H0_9AGAM|nr:hypothetical protein PISMIDRAFT_589027 [Pisolithus microcarpus 441]